MLFDKELERQGKEQSTTDRILLLAGTIAMIGAGALYAYPLIGNNSYIPRVRVCFRPPQILEKRNERFKSCDNAETVKTISAPMLEHFRQIDMAWDSYIVKNGVLEGFPDNLSATTTYVRFSVLLGAIASVSFAMKLSGKIKHKHLLYRMQQVYIEKLTSEANAAVAMRQQEIDAIVAPTNPVQAQIQDLLASKDLELALGQKELAQTKIRLEIAKAEQEIESALSRTGGKGIDTAQTLLKALESPQYAWLLEVVKGAKPIWIIGGMGSGKTSTMVGIALIREALGWKVAHVCDPHFEGDNRSKWELLDLGTSEVFKSKPSVLNVLSKMPMAWAARIPLRLPLQESIQFLIDEYTNLADLDPSEALPEELTNKYLGSKEEKNKQAIIDDVLLRFFKSMFSDSRKGGSLAIGVAHAFTNAIAPAGTAKMRQKDSFIIHKFSTDGRTPSPHAELDGMTDPKGKPLPTTEVKMPWWFEPNIIKKHLLGVQLIDFDRVSSSVD